MIEQSCKFQLLSLPGQEAFAQLLSSLQCSLQRIWSNANFNFFEEDARGGDTFGEDTLGGDAFEETLIINIIEEDTLTRKATTMEEEKINWVEDTEEMYPFPKLTFSKKKCKKLLVFSRMAVCGI